MDLDEIAKLILQRKEELRKEVRENARNLRLQDVIKEIKFSPEDFRYVKFKDGDSLEFPIGKSYGLPGAFYSVRVYKDVLVLDGYVGQVTVASFRGKEVEDYYSSLSAAILKAHEEHRHF